MKHERMDQFLPAPNSGAFYGKLALKELALSNLRSASGLSYIRWEWKKGMCECMFSHLVGVAGAASFDGAFKQYNFPMGFQSVVIGVYDNTRGNAKRLALEIIESIPPGLDLHKVANQMEFEMESRRVKVPTLPMLLKAIKHVESIQYPFWVREAKRLLKQLEVA